MLMFVWLLACSTGPEALTTDGDRLPVENEALGPPPSSTPEWLLTRPGSGSGPRSLLPILVHGETLLSGVEQGGGWRLLGPDGAGGLEVRVHANTRATTWQDVGDVLPLHPGDEVVLAEYPSDVPPPGRRQVDLLATPACIRVLDPATGHDLAMMELPCSFPTDLQIADLDADGANEIVTRVWDEDCLPTIFAFAGDGTLRWSENTTDAHGRKFAIAQIDADPELEVLTGDDLWDFPNGVVEQDRYAFTDGPVEALDVDGDGIDEVLWHGYGAVELRDGPTGALRWARSFASVANVHLTDVEGDGQPEVMVSTSSGYEVLSSVTGQPLRAPLTGVGSATYGGGSAALDLDGDGRRDLFLSAARIGSFDENWNQRWLSRGTRTWIGPRVLDFDRDGDDDAIYLAQGGDLTVIDMTSRSLVAEITLRSPTNGTLVELDFDLEDVNGDGYPELLTGGTSDAWTLWSILPGGALSVLRHNPVAGRNVYNVEIGDVGADGTPNVITLEEDSFMHAYTLAGVEIPFHQVENTRTEGYLDFEVEDINSDGIQELWLTEWMNRTYAIPLDTLMLRDPAVASSKSFQVEPTGRPEMMTAGIGGFSITRFGPVGRNITFTWFRSRLEDARYLTPDIALARTASHLEAISLRNGARVWMSDEIPTVRGPTVAAWNGEIWTATSLGPAVYAR